ncbi:unnamed protein product [Pleuronectes platessa]|uniref:Uncharacterized protein n=1 Tax=Pleuronectes platessa TaxID=8262 RepID=A0A9N7UE54_PLEPL|nr:unnamed protein product [Pleuronectes platessa]
MNGCSVWQQQSLKSAFPAQRRDTQHRHWPANYPRSSPIGQHADTLANARPVRHCDISSREESKDTSCAHIANPLRQTGHLDLSAATLLCLQTLRRTTWMRALDGRMLRLGGGGLVCVGDVCTYMLHPQKATPRTLA